MSADEPPAILDLRGLRCPLPALMTRRALRRLAPGGAVIVISDDPLARLDVPNAAREAGGAVTAMDADGAATRFSVRAAAALRTP